MNDFDVLKHAQGYIESMANGINPLNGEAVSEEDFINNPRIIRCLFYVNDKLKELIANGGTVTQRRHREYKEAFVYDKAKIDLVEREERGIALSVIIRKVVEVYGDNCKLTYQMVARLLFDKGIFIENPEKSPKYIAAPGAVKLGVWSEIVHGQNGDRMATFFDIKGQNLVLEALKDLS